MNMSGVAKSREWLGFCGGSKARRSRSPSMCPESSCLDFSPEPGSIWASMSAGARYEAKEKRGPEIYQ